MVYLKSSYLEPKKKNQYSLKEKRSYRELINMVEVLYKSDTFLIVNKPYDMYINSTDESEQNTLEHNLLNKPPQIHFVHRLDYATSGAICLALSKTAAALAGRQFERRTADKYYIAVVRGHADFEMADVNASIGYDNDHLDGSKRMCADIPSVGSKCLHPRSAQTRVLVIAKGTYDGQPVTRVLLKPYTGRRHQLRVHCSIIGHTVLGDYTYSNRTDKKPHRMFLHAFRLKLPIEREPIDVMTDDPFSKDNEFIKHWRALPIEENEINWEDLFNKINTVDTGALLCFNKDTIL